MQDNIASYFASRMAACTAVLNSAWASPDGYRMDPKTPKVDQLLAADVLRMNGFAPDRLGVWRSAAPLAVHAEAFDKYAKEHLAAGFKTEEIMEAVFGHTKFRYWSTERLRQLGLTSQVSDGVRLWKRRRLTHEENMAAAEEIGRRIGPELAARLAKSFEHAKVSNFPNRARE